MRKKSSFKLFEAIDQMIASGAPPGSMLIADDIDNPKKFVIVEGQDMKSNIKPVTIPTSTKPKSLIDREDFNTLNEIPPETDWIKERRNRSPKTARGYQVDVDGFKEFLGIKQPEDYRKVTRNHVTEWIDHLKKQDLTNETIARKVSAISSLFKYYCERSALKDNPCKNITRPRVQSNLGKTDAISDNEAKKLMDSPPATNLRGLRDRAILAVFLYHGLRRSEVADLKVASIHDVLGVPHLKVKGKGSKTRDLPLHPVVIQRIYTYLEADNRKKDLDTPLFCSLQRYKDSYGQLKHMTSNAIYDIVMLHARAVGLKVENFHPHSLRATFATNALLNNADLGKVQDYLGHANIQTTRIYDKRGNDLADSPTFKVKY